MESEMKITGLAPWFGAKRTLAPTIVRLLGKHHAYWEPFCGSMAVLFAKQACRNETLNDMNGHVVNLAKVVASNEGPALFERLLRTTFCETVFLEAKAREKEYPDRTGLDAAYDFFVESWMGKNGVAGTRKSNTSFCVRYTANGGDPATRFKSAVDSIPAWANRLRGVWILQRDAFELIPRIEDKSGTAIYVDPPYLKKGARYIHDFKPEDHARLAETLARFRQARVVVSYYQDPLLEELYPRSAWTHIEAFQTKSLLSQGQLGKTGEFVVAPEMLIVNGVDVTTLFDEHK